MEGFAKARTLTPASLALLRTQPFAGALLVQRRLRDGEGREPGSRSFASAEDDNQDKGTTSYGQETHLAQEIAQFAQHPIFVCLPRCILSFS